LYGEARGIVVTNDDSGEIATLTVQGVGRITGPGGKVSFHVSTFFRSTSTGKLASLNNVVGVFEYEMDESGNSTAKNLGMDIMAFCYRYDLVNESNLL
jgi:hypothetical protein